MRLSETAQKFAYFGMKHEASDIIDFIAIRFSLLISIVAGLVAAIWIGRVVDAPAGLIAGIGIYGLSMILCSFGLLRGHRR
ncbi:MAG: hypothetical protein WB780_04225 [Candidatus Acidiferrales bacterium]